MSQHSPLGASAAERWMNCPGSNVILQQLDLPETEESEYAKEGTAAHAVAAHALRNGLDMWECEGQEWNGVIVDKEMVDALQDYLDVLAAVRAEHNKGFVKELIEYPIAGDFHPLFFGTCDDAILGEEVLDITDLKYGAGIAVDVVNNPQLKYYAVGVLEKFMGPKRVRLRIVQPRAFHEDGPIRVWETTSEELLTWKKEVLIPAMRRAEIDTTLTPGDHCRFCPAKLACPVLTALFGASVTADASILPNFSNDALSRNFKLTAAVKHYIKALEDEVYRRLSHGQEVPEFKLVPKKANRVFTSEGATLVKDEFGADAIETKLKTPAQIEKLGAAGKKFVREHAYTPQTGLTVAPLDDDRVGVKIQPPAEAFAHIAAQAAE